MRKYIDCLVSLKTEDDGSKILHPQSHGLILEPARCNLLRRLGLERVFGLNLDGISVLINPRCSSLLMDLQEMKEDENGG
ncbi:hypothetical protein [Chryseolinea sp. H1M3-3]|uniref:hypothetical protein n=1 Tax=Chryseolinea sp. H1M3-3 TaxID=3034144 RepID=UPI0023EC49DE|nr:hypothetical protein [Chryseolinea sp. H1M3-3]